MSTLQFRKALPSDVSQAVPLILLSGPTSFAYVFNNGKKNASDFLTYAFARAAGEFSYDNHFVLEKDARIIGTGAIYSSQKSKNFTRKDIINVLSIYKLSSFGIIKKGLRIERILAMPKTGELYIGHIAIASSERGKGFGEMIMTKIMNEFKLQGGESFVLDVDVDNVAAIKLYEKLGFQQKELMNSDLKSNFGHVPSHFRFVHTRAE